MSLVKVYVYTEIISSQIIMMYIYFSKYILDIFEMIKYKYTCMRITYVNYIHIYIYYFTINICGE